MIRFNLVCDAGHEFDGWFRSNEDYEGQHKSGLVSCPTCHSAKVAKALMAPAVLLVRPRVSGASGGTGLLLQPELVLLLLVESARWQAWRSHERAQRLAPAHAQLAELAQAPPAVPRRPCSWKMSLP